MAWNICRDLYLHCRITCQALTHYVSKQSHLWLPYVSQSSLSKYSLNISVPYLEKITNISWFFVSNISKIYYYLHFYMNLKMISSLNCFWNWYTDTNHSKPSTQLWFSLHIWALLQWRWNSTTWYFKFTLDVWYFLNRL